MALEQSKQELIVQLKFNPSETFIRGPLLCGSPQHPYNSQTGEYGPSPSSTVPRSHSQVIHYPNPYTPMQFSHPFCKCVPMAGPQYPLRNIGIRLVALKAHSCTIQCMEQILHIIRSI